MTAYKYVARDEESRVNWGDISKKWSDAIITGEETREKKRQDIQTATDKLTDSIINAPMGDNEGINGWYSNFADQSSEYLLDANRRLKSGNLKVRDYNTIMANMTQGTERMTGLAKDYSDNYTIKMERLQNDKSQQAEVAMMELAEGFANFTNTQGIVNPTNGMVSIAKNDTGETVTIPQMRAYINMQYDKYDVGAALDEQVTRLAADKKVIMSGDVKTRESQLRAWELAKDNLLDAELADGLHVSSILTEEVGGYNVVTDATKVGENDVLFVLDPKQPSAGYRVPLYGLDLSNMTEADLDMIFSADLDDAQRSALIKQAEEQKVTAREWINTDFERRLGVIETPMAEQRTPKPSDASVTGRKGAKTGTDNLQAIYTANEVDSNKMIAAINYFEGKKPGLDLDVIMIDGVRTFAIKRPEEEETRYIPMNTDYNTWATAVASFLIPGNEYLSETLKENPLPEGASVGNAIGGVVSERRVDLEEIGKENVTYTDSKGNKIETPFSDFISATPKPDSNDQPAIQASIEINSALDQLNLSNKIQAVHIVESELEDLYSGRFALSTIRQPGIKISSENIPSDIVISYQEGDKATIGPILELLAQDKTFTMDDIYALMGEDSVDITKELIEDGYLQKEQDRIPNPDKPAELD